MPTLFTFLFLVQGVVLDPSDRPISGARVVCNGSSAVTGADGRFTVAGENPCEVSAPRFETQTVRLSGDGVVRLNVAPLSQRVVVSATRLETTVEEAGVSASVVTGEDFERRQHPVVLDVLREIPGLHVAKFGRNGGATQVFARGSQRTGTLVMIDGVPVNDPGGDLNFAHLLSGSIERMEVVRGPESALFGAEASAAVIQIFTKRGDPERKIPRGSVWYERGSFQTDRWIANLTGGSGGGFLDYALSTEQFHSVGEFPNDFYRNTTGNANLGFRLSPATQVRTLLRGFDSTVGVPNRVAYGMFDFDAHRRNRDYTASLRLDDVRGRHYTQRASVGYHRLRDTFQDERRDGPYRVAALVTGTSRVRLLELIDPRRLPLSPAEIPLGARVATRTNFLEPASSLSVPSRTSLEYQGTLSHTKGAAVFGYEYEQQEGSISGQNVERGNHGVFVHKQQTIGNRLFLSGGVRAERSSVFGTKVTPRGAASLRLLPGTFVRFSAGRGITEPSLLQNFARESTFAGNPALRPEKTVSYEAGVVQEWLGRRLRTEVSAFWNSFEDLIVFLSLAGQPVSTWQNIESSRARGLEFSAETKPLRYVTLSGNYTLLSTRVLRSNTPNSLVTGVGQELLRRPRHAGSVWVSVAPRRWFLQTGAMLLGERQDMDGAGFGLTRNPGYQNVYAAASFRANAHVSPILRVDNLLNSRYQEVLGYSALSRSIRGGVRLEW